MKTTRLEKRSEELGIRRIKKIQTTALWETVTKSADVLRRHTVNVDMGRFLIDGVRKKRRSIKVKCVCFFFLKININKGIEGIYKFGTGFNET